MWRKCLNGHKGRRTEAIVMCKGVQTMADKFCNAPEVERIAQELIRDERYPHGRLREANIKYLYRTGTWTSKGKAVLGKTHKASDRDRHLHGYDFVVVINATAWQNLTERQKRALIDHELSHCEPEVNAAGEVTGWTVVTHDLEEFAGVVRRHGLWYEDVKAFAGALEEAQQLQLPLVDGQVDLQDVLQAAADKAAEAVRRETGADLTVSVEVVQDEAGESAGGAEPELVEQAG